MMMMTSFQHADSFGEIRQQQTVDNKARRVLYETIN